MKEIKCYIRPRKLDPVLDALRSSPELPGITCSKVEGFGSIKSLPAEGGIRAEMIKLEIVVSDDQVEMVKEIVRRHADTGHAGDGMIFILPVEESLRIRSDDRELE